MDSGGRCCVASVHGSHCAARSQPRSWFAWLLIVIGSAPIAFVLPRGVAAYYIPLVGYAMFAATVLVRTREFLFRQRSEALALASQAVLFTVLFTVVWRWQIHHQRRFPDYWKELATIESTAAQFRSHREWFHPGGRVLIVNDPFPEYEWASTFIAILIAKDSSVNIHSLVKLDPKPTKEQMAQYTTVLASRTDGLSKHGCDIYEAGEANQIEGLRRQGYSQCRCCGPRTLREDDAHIRPSLYSRGS